MILVHYIRIEAKGRPPPPRRGNAGSPVLFDRIKRWAVSSWSPHCMRDECNETIELVVITNLLAKADFDDPKRRFLH